MLQIKTIKNHLIAGKEKEAFCFRSVASQTLDENALIKEMLSYNSSFTEADISGLFSVLGTVVNKYLAKGYNVILPFGALRANATGTCETINTSFSQGTGNHQIGFIFNPSEKTLSEVNKNLEYKQVLPDSTKEGKIFSHRMTHLKLKIHNGKKSSFVILNPGLLPSSRHHLSHVIEIHSFSIAFLDEQKNFQTTFLSMNQLL